MKMLLFFLSILLSIPIHCNESIAPESCELIIFIHGTIKPPDISFSSLYKIINDEVDDTILALATEHVRKNPFFYRGQPIQELGLKPIVITSPDSKEVTTRTAQTIAEIYDFQYSLAQKNTTKRFYYTFGWNGLLSVRKRHEAAGELYRTLQAEIRKFKAQNIEPKITLVTYSHGGNVALYLPMIQEDQENKENPMEPLSVDTLIMLACPIQKETDYFVQNNLFKKVYNLFSTEDCVQQWDFFSSQEQFFSQRMFRNRRTFTVPNKIVQVRIRTTKKIRCALPETIAGNVDTLLSLSPKCFEHRDPGHMEIGGFSWGNYWYRNTFPLFPLPIIALVPTIITTIESLLPTTTLATFDFIPEHNCAIVTDNYSKHKKLHILWTPEERIKLWDNLCTNIPLDYTYYNQETHIAEAIRTAHETLLKTKNGRQYRKPHNKTLARLIEKTDYIERPHTLIAHNKNNGRKQYRFTHHNHNTIT